MRPLGARTWVVAGGRIPPDSEGPEPELTSREELSILNTAADAVELTLTIFHADRDPVGPYELHVEGERVRRVRVNDLIDPEAVPLGRDYAVVVLASAPVVVQHSHLDSRRGGLSSYSTLAFPVE
jgi:hypothetical protein